MTHRTVIITGGNIGDRAGYLRQAREMLACGVGNIIDESAVYESEPWGEMNDRGGCFLNQVLVLDTDLGPLALLDKTQEIELRLGRASKGEATGYGRKYSSRTIDIDILFYDNAIVHERRLEVPHPMIAEREFVLVPLSEVLPRYRHPVTGKTPIEMLNELNKKDE